MSIRLAQVYEYLDSHPVSRQSGDFQSLLEMLHYIYTSSNPIDAQEIRAGFGEINDLIRSLPLASQDRIFTATCGLCLKHEELSFAHGILVGIHLMTELSALP